MKRFILAAIAALVVAPASASAFTLPSAICVPEAASATVKTPPAGGECPAGQNKRYVASEEEITILHYIKFNATGVDARPTIEIPMNVHIYATEAHQGNLLIGEESKLESVEIGKENLLMSKDWSGGEHNLIGGASNYSGGKYDAIFGNSNTSYGSTADLVAGKANTTVIGPTNKTNEGGVVFGQHNTLDDSVEASVLGGRENEGGSQNDVIVGGELNQVLPNGGSTRADVIGGGASNVVQEGIAGVISGGHLNKLLFGESDWLGGGYKNTVKEHVKYASVFGGKENEAKAEYEAIP